MLLRVTLNTLIVTTIASIPSIAGVSALTDRDSTGSLHRRVACKSGRFSDIHGKKCLTSAPTKGKWYAQP